MRKRTDTVEIVDLLHTGRAARVPADRIATVVASWLAEYDAHSPLVDDLASAVIRRDWITAHQLGEWLSIDVMVAA